MQSATYNNVYRVAIAVYVRVNMKPSNGLHAIIWKTSIGEIQIRYYFICINNFTYWKILRGIVRIVFDLHIQ